MDKIIDQRFERVEKALAALIESIGKYNPSIPIGHDLVLADQELSDGLKQVQTHQNNRLRIQKLRETQASLDKQILDTVKVLATTRKEMTSTATTQFPDRAPNPVSFEELLSFARRISKTTMPPAGVTNGFDLDGPGDATPGPGQDPGGVPATPGAMAQTPNAATTPTPTNGAVTPAPATPAAGRQDSIVPDPQQQQSVQAAAGGVTNAGGVTGALAVPETYSAWMNPHAGGTFTPWPHEELARGGELAANQALEDRSIDVRGYDPVEEERRAAEAAAEAKRVEEERVAAERAAQVERERRAREELERRRAEREREQLEASRRGSIALATGGMGGAGSSPTRPLASSPAVKQQFQFMGDDGDSDDESDDNPLQD